MKKYVQNVADCTIMAGAKSTGPGRVILEAVRIRRDELQKQVNDNPQRDDVVLKNDIVYKLAEIHALNWILGLPLKARDYIDKFPEREL